VKRRTRNITIALAVTGSSVIVFLIGRKVLSDPLDEQLDEQLEDNDYLDAVAGITDVKVTCVGGTPRPGESCASMHTRLNRTAMFAREQNLLRELYSDRKSPAPISELLAIDWRSYANDRTMTPFLRDVRRAFVRAYQHNYPPNWTALDDYLKENRYGTNLFDRGQVADWKRGETPSINNMRGRSGVVGLMAKTRKFTVVR